MAKKKEKSNMHEVLWYATPVQRVNVRKEPEFSDETMFDPPRVIDPGFIVNVINDTMVPGWLRIEVPLMGGSYIGWVVKNNVRLVKYDEIKPLPFEDDKIIEGAEERAENGQILTQNEG